MLALGLELELELVFGWAGVEPELVEPELVELEPFALVLQLESAELGAQRVEVVGDEVAEPVAKLLLGGESDSWGRNRLSGLHRRIVTKRK